LNFCLQLISNNPILQPQSFNPLKLRKIIANQHQSLAARMRGDVNVIAADNFSCLLQLKADISIVIRGFKPVGQDFQTREKVLEISAVTFRPGTFLRTKAQLWPR